MVQSNCLNCGKPFVRKHPSQKFCPKRGNRHYCKDQYHNTIRHATGRITEARREFLRKDEDDDLYPFGIDDF